MAGLTPQNAEFAIVSFEGPDEYARAGGLAVRVRDLTEALAEQGFRTHHIFIGDPNLPAIEERGNLVLHRWAQWISAYHPGGVYDGEWGKINDLSTSFPSFLYHDLVQPAVAAGKAVVVMGEDWQTASTMIQAAATMNVAGLGRHVVPVWTANNIYGFESIDLATLAQNVAVMTVSRFMKHRMESYGLDALVCPNGLSPASLVDVPENSRLRLRSAFQSEIALFKIGRFSPDKRWLMAIDAVALLKQMGIRTKLLIRGDKLPYGGEVLNHADEMGLTVVPLRERYQTVDALAGAIEAHSEADVLQLAAFLPDALLPVIYAAVDGVLANSGFEPFGLVGLEVMGAGGLAFVGSTGEQYAEPQRNAVVLDTADPWEIVVALRRLLGAPHEIERMKSHGKETARAFLWPEVLRELFAKLEYVALTRGVEVFR